MSLFVLKMSTTLRSQKWLENFVTNLVGNSRFHRTIVAYVYVGVVVYCKFKKFFTKKRDLGLFWPTLYTVVGVKFLKNCVRNFPLQSNKRQTDKQSSHTLRDVRWRSQKVAEVVIGKTLHSWTSPLTCKQWITKQKKGAGIVLKSNPVRHLRICQRVGIELHLLIVTT